MNQNGTTRGRSRSLQTSLAAVITLAVTIATCGVGWLAFATARTALVDARRESLEAVAQSKEAVLVEILRAQAEQATSFGALRSVRALFASPEPGEPPVTGAAGAAPGLPGAGANVSAELRAEQASLELRALLASTSFEWVTVVDAHGLALAGTRAVSRPDGEDGAASPVLVRTTSWSGMHESPTGGARYRLEQPIVERGHILGAIVAEVRADRIWDALLDRTGLGVTGETYLVGAHGAYLSPTLSAHGTEGRDGRDGRRAGALEQLATHDASGGGEWVSYDGERAIGYVMYDDLRALGVADWAIVCEMGTGEALAGVRQLGGDIVGATVAFALAALGIAYVVARRWSMPLARLADSARYISSGDLRVTPTVELRDDEIGVLADAFATMHGGLRSVLGGMRDGLFALSKTAGEVNTSARKYAAASAVQAAAVASTSTSLVETRKSSASTAEAARAVLEATEAAAATGRRGLEAIESGVDAMNAIEERVRGIATEALELSQQSTQIGQIVAVVNDLSEQSNVLAVNASVEAAKAGDRGRGFAVVAAEVRRLAEQSKRSTAQIRKILGDVQRAIESVVMAAEEGTKRSEDGRHAIDGVRVTVHELATTLEENADSARRIASSAADQAMGIAQLSGALEAMVASGKETARESRALEGSASALAALGVQLDGVAARYKL